MWLSYGLVAGSVVDDTPQQGPTFQMPAIDAEMEATFLEILATHANVSEAARASGYDRTTWYHRRNDRDEDGEPLYPDFAAAWETALGEGRDALRLEARRRGEHGVSKPVFYQGVVCGHIQEYSDTLLCRLLEAHCPEHKRTAAIDLRTPPGEQVRLEIAPDIDRARRVAELLIELEPPDEGEDGGDGTPE